MIEGRGLSFPPPNPSMRPSTDRRTIHDVEGPADDEGDDAVPHQAHGDVRQGPGEGHPQVLLGALVVRHLGEAPEGPERDGVAGARVLEGGEAANLVGWLIGWLVGSGDCMAGAASWGRSVQAIQ